MKQVILALVAAVLLGAGAGFYLQSHGGLTLKDPVANQRVQARIATYLEGLSPRAAARILGHMQPQQAASVLTAMRVPTVDRILVAMNPTTAARLLEDTRGMPP